MTHKRYSATEALLCFFRVSLKIRGFVLTQLCFLLLTSFLFAASTTYAVDYPYSSDYQSQESEEQDRNAYPRNNTQRENQYNPNRLPQENYYKFGDNPERYRSNNPNASEEGTFENPYNTKIGGHSRTRPREEENPNPDLEPVQNL